MTISFHPLMKFMKKNIQDCRCPLTSKQYLRSYDNQLLPFRFTTVFVGQPLAFSVSPKEYAFFFVTIYSVEYNLFNFYIFFLKYTIHGFSKKQTIAIHMYFLKLCLQKLQILCAARYVKFLWKPGKYLFDIHQHASTGYHINICITSES